MRLFDFSLLSPNFVEVTYNQLRHIKAINFDIPRYIYDVACIHELNHRVPRLKTIWFPFIFLERGLNLDSSQRVFKTLKRS